MESLAAPAIQREVQRLLGRCMLRLQQYERLMKVVLEHHELAGPMDELDEQRTSSAKALSNKTLGQLANALFDTCIVPEGFERELLPEATTPTDRISFGVSFRVTMEPERLAEVQSAIEELVKVRNGLVHHFIEQFDLWSQAGCSAALNHLSETYTRIDRHYEELSAWAKGLDQMRALAGQFMSTNAFQELLVNGIAPDGTFDWPATGIVSALREAALQLGIRGWTSLEAATAWIQAKHPEQTPQKYGCRSWPHMLHESKLFELTYRTDDSGRKRGWFRARAG